MSRTEPLELKIAENTRSFDWTGSVLDIGYDAGYLGELLHAVGSGSEVASVDLSSGLTAATSVKNFHRQPVTIAPIQDLHLQRAWRQATTNVACSSTIQPYTAIHYPHISCSRASPSYHEIDDPKFPSIWKILARYGDGRWSRIGIKHAVGNHFPTPEGWKKVEDE
ncbi:MAG: hypothetical protein Q9186_000589 [Xanthomendoza sp. 1 TL-2023]